MWPRLPAVYWAVTLLAILVGPSAAADIAGRIVLKKDLTRKVVDPGIYDLRGSAIARNSSKSERGPYGRVAVWLEPSGPIPVSPGKAEMRQAGRRFEPDLLILPVGSTVDFPNLDPIFHNIFSLSRSKTFDLGYYPKGKSRSVRFPTSGVVQIYCHIHADMYGVIVIAPTSWSTIPGNDGSFSLTGVTPGQYHLVVWQKTNGLTRKKLSIPASGTVHITVALPEESDQ